MFRRHVTATVAAVGIALAPLLLSAEAHVAAMGFDRLDTPPPEPTREEATTIAVIGGLLLVLALLGYDDN